MKVYKSGESIPDKWVLLHRRESRFAGRPMWVLTFKLPWKLRLYTINNDSIQRRYPRISLYFGTVGDPWFRHQFTQAEFQRQGGEPQ